ncbi:unnamed protein product, partial [Staurois parvus]
MQTASTNICERMGRFQEFSEFKRSNVIGCHLCIKSICEICLLLNIPWPTVSDIIIKWKQLGTTATQPRSSRPHKLTECMLKSTVRRSRQMSADAFELKTCKLCVAFRLAQQQCIESFM